MAEMAQKKPLFAGDSEIDQIFQIFKIMGTPNEENWPEAQKLEYFKPTFPKWKQQSFEDHAQYLDRVGIDLLEQLVALEPKK
jgi:cyclin-dependent kinase